MDFLLTFQYPLALSFWQDAPQPHREASVKILDNESYSNLLKGSMDDTPLRFNHNNSFDTFNLSQALV